MGELGIHVQLATLDPPDHGSAQILAPPAPTIL